MARDHNEKEECSVDGVCVCVFVCVCVCVCVCVVVLCVCVCVVRVCVCVVCVCVCVCACAHACLIRVTPYQDTDAFLLHSHPSVHDLINT